MKRFYYLFIILIPFVFNTGCVSVKGPVKIPETTEQKRITAIDFLLNDPNIQNALVGIYVESLKDGRVLYHRNEHRLFVPASNMKLFTTAAALVNLGPDYRYQTGIYTNGNVEKGVLSGDLIVRGSGDPTISGRFYNDDKYAVFKAWADSLKQLGIKEINGNLVGDNSFFDGPTLAEGWNWDDEQYWYSAHVTALAYNDNCVDVTITPAEQPGGPVNLTVDPKLPFVTLVNQTRTVADSINTLDFTRSPGGNVITFFGDFPKQKKQDKESVALQNPSMMFLQVLKDVLAANGISVSGRLQLIEQPGFEYQKLHRLFYHFSPPLREIVRVVNKISHNFYADMLLKTLGATFKREGSFAAGAQFVREWLQSIGVSPNEFINVDGSGLSRKNFVAPNATATLLRWMYHSKYFEDYFDSLPVAGKDGSMGDRMKGTLAEGRIHAKTGYVKHMRSLSGYAIGTNNQTYLFVMMMNNYSVPVRYINLLQDRICEQIVQF